MRTHDGEKATASPIDVELGVSECRDKGFVAQKYILVFELKFSKSLNELPPIGRIGSLGLVVIPIVQFVQELLLPWSRCGGI
jgi:hypothetical protein